MSGILNIMFAGGLSFRLDTATISETTVGGPSTAGIRLDSDGQVYYRDDASGGVAYTARYNWISSPALAGNYEAVWTAGAGTVDTTPGAAGTGLNLGTDRTWEETNPVALESASFTLIIRVAGGGATVAGPVTITLEVDGSA